MKVIYLAGPFRSKTQWGITQNVQRAERVSLELWKQGWVVVCPHKMTEHFQNECPDKLWLDGCLELLARCDAIYMLKGWWDSEGSRGELKRAGELGLEIYYEESITEEDNDSVL